MTNNNDAKIKEELEKTVYNPPHFTGLTDDAINGISFALNLFLSAPDTPKTGKLILSAHNNGRGWNMNAPENERFDSVVKVKYDTTTMSEDDIFKAIDEAFKALEVVCTIVWDDSDYYEEGKSPDEVGDDTQIGWDDFTENLGSDFHELLDGCGGLEITGRSLGWRNLSGSKIITYEGSEDFINKVFPKTDLTIKGTFYHDRAEFVVYHHDSPTGEFYSASPVHMCESCDDEKADPDNKKENSDDEHICDYCLEQNFLTDQQLFEQFLQLYFDGEKYKLKDAYEIDENTHDENWSNYTDSECSAGKITNQQYHYLPSLDKFI